MKNCHHVSVSEWWRRHSVKARYCSGEEGKNVILKKEEVQERLILGFPASFNVSGWRNKNKETKKRKCKKLQ